MSTIPAQEIDRKRDRPGGLYSACVPATSQLRLRKESLPLRLRRRSMTVIPCSQRPYTPGDLAGLYDLRAKCDGGQRVSINYHPYKAQRRQQCVTTSNISGMVQQSVARSATEGLASYGGTPAKPRSARRNALTASRHARKVTADGYFGFTPPENGCGETPTAISRCSEFRIEKDGKYPPVPTEEIARNLDNLDGRNHIYAPPFNGSRSPDAAFCSTLGDAT
jgi:hypothetical protein